MLNVLAIVVNDLLICRVINGLSVGFVRVVCIASHDVSSHITGLIAESGGLIINVIHGRLTCILQVLCMDGHVT